MGFAIPFDELTLQGLAEDLLQFSSCGLCCSQMPGSDAGVSSIGDGFQIRPRCSLSSLCSGVEEQIQNLSLIFSFSLSRH